MVDIICYLCEEDNLLDPVNALQRDVNVIVSKTLVGAIRHVETNSRIRQSMLRI